MVARNWRVLGLSILLWTGPLVAQVDVYRSVDEQGVVAFSDTRQHDTDEHFQLSMVTPAPEMIEAHGRLMKQQLELIALLEQSRQARAQETLERRRQNVELARARLALEQERNAVAHEESSRNYGYAYPVGYSYRYQRRQGYRLGYRHEYGYGQRSGQLPARPGYGSRPGYGGRPGHGVDHGLRRGSQTLSKPFITKG
ncbi:MAG: DUF4124 domain-containing protein [Chloroflexi bacterium]|nr:MAG: DUF4124 domain-containing protein [Chloroflexota bacterium]